MINLTDNAKRHLDSYLQQVRTCLKDCSTVDVNEVEQNIKEHIENEFQGVTKPVSFDDLEAILKKLGSPEQWVPEEEISLWRKFILRLRSGPEDWRLAYISFGLFLLSLLVGKEMPFFAVFLWPIIIFRGTANVVLLLASFCVARAALTVTPAKDKLDGQKWLLYPPLIIVYVPFVILILGWPLSPFNLAPKEIINQSVLALGVTGLWWTVLGIVFCIWPRLTRLIFRPFVNWWNRKQAIALMILGLLLVIGSAIKHFWI
jgi:hypothetical protein